MTLCRASVYVERHVVLSRDDAAQTHTNWLVRAARVNWFPENLPSVINATPYLYTCTLAQLRPAAFRKTKVMA